MGSSFSIRRFGNERLIDEDGQNVNPALTGKGFVVFQNGPKRKLKDVLHRQRYGCYARPTVLSNDQPKLDRPRKIAAIRTAMSANKTTPTGIE